MLFSRSGGRDFKSTRGHLFKGFGNLNKYYFSNVYTHFNFQGIRHEKFQCFISPPYCRVCISGPNINFELPSIFQVHVILKGKVGPESILYKTSFKFNQNRF